MSRLRATGRAVRALGHVVRGLWIIRSEFAQLTPAQTHLHVREWSRQMLHIMGVTLVVRGEDLLAATHVHVLLQALMGWRAPGTATPFKLVDGPGAAFGKGFGYLPYRFFTEGLAWDFWTIRAES